MNRPANRRSNRDGGSGRQAAHWWAGWLLVGLAWACSCQADAAFLSPEVVVASPTGHEVYVAAKTGQQLLVVDRASGTVSRRIPLSASPSGLVLSPDGTTVYVTAGIAPGFVSVLDVRTGTERARIPAGHSPTAPVLSADGNTLFVCDRYRARLLAVDLASQQLAGEVPVGREPVAAALTPDGEHLLIANLLPTSSATAPVVAARVDMIRTRDSRQVATVELPNGSIGVRGLCVSADGRFAYAVHTLAHYQLATTQVDRGWMCTSALSIVELAGFRWLNTVLLDDVDLGAANPGDVVCTPDGQWLCVSHSGTHEISVIDRPALHQRLEEVAGGLLPSDTVGEASEPPNDLSFLVGIRRRVELPGHGPRGLAVAGGTLYAAEYFSDSLAAIDLAGAATLRPRSVLLGPRLPPTEVRRGEMLFHDANLCFQRWQSCSSCHPDARVDGLNWDLLNDGLGNPKNTRSMLLAHVTPPAMSLGVRETAETAVRAGLNRIQFVVRPEADALAIDAYLKSLQPIPSPHRGTGQFADRIQRGERVFGQAGCRECHPPPLYTSLRAYDVGTGYGREAGAAFDTPGLAELWRTAPYLHDGRATDLRVLFQSFNCDDRHGKTSALSAAELDDLVAFPLSL